MWFAIAFLWGSFLAVVLPFLIVPQHVTAANPALVPSDFKNTALAILEGFGLVFALIVQPAAGAFSDSLRTRWGRRRPLMVIGVAAGVLGLLAMSRADLFVLMIVFYCVLQCGMNIAQGAYQGLLPDVVPEKERSTQSGLIGVAQLVGQVTGTLAAGFVAPREMCLVTAAVLVAVLLVTCVFVKEKPLAPVVKGARRGLAAYAAEFKGHADFLWVVLSRFSAYTGLAGIERFAANYLRDTYHGHFDFFGYRFVSDQTATSVTFIAVLLLALITTYPAVAVSKRVGRRKVLIAGSLAGALGSFLLIAATSLTESVLFASLIGVCTGFMFSVDWAYMVDLSPPDRAGTFLGFSNIATAGSQAAMPTLMGPVIDAVNGPSGDGGYKVLFFVSGLFFILGALILLKVRQHGLPASDLPAVPLTA